MADEYDVGQFDFVEAIDAIECLVEQKEACRQFAVAGISPEGVRKVIQVQTVLGRMQMIEAGDAPHAHMFDAVLEAGKGLRYLRAEQLAVERQIVGKEMRQLATCVFEQTALI